MNKIAQWDPNQRLEDRPILRPLCRLGTHVPDNEGAAVLSSWLECRAWDGFVTCVRTVVLTPCSPPAHLRVHLHPCALQQPNINDSSAAAVPTSCPRYGSWFTTKLGSLDLTTRWVANNKLELRVSSFCFSSAFLSRLPSRYQCKCATRASELRTSCPPPLYTNLYIYLPKLVSQNNISLIQQTCCYGNFAQREGCFVGGSPSRGQTGAECVRHFRARHDHAR